MTHPNLQPNIDTARMASICNCMYYFSDDNSQVNTFYLEQKPDVNSTMVPLAAVSSIHQDGDTPSEGFTLATASLGLSRAVEENNFQTMTITTLPTISEDSVEIQEGYTRLAKIQTLDVNPVIEESNILDSNIEQEEHFSSMPIVKKISMEQLTRRPVKFKVCAIIVTWTQLFVNYYCLL